CPARQISSRAAFSAISAPGPSGLKRSEYFLKSARLGIERGRRAVARRPPRPTPLRRGRRIPEGGAGIGRGRALRPAPQERPPAGATNAGGSPHCSGVAERQGHVFGAFARLHPE